MREGRRLGEELEGEPVAGVVRVQQIAAVYRNFGWDGPLAFVKDAAGLSDEVMGEQTMASHDAEASRWFAAHAPMLPYGLSAA